MIDNTNPNNYASKGVAGTGLGLGIAGTALALLNNNGLGGLGGILGAATRPCSPAAQPPRLRRRTRRLHS